MMRDDRVGAYSLRIWSRATPPTAASEGEGHLQRPDRDAEKNLYKADSIILCLSCFDVDGGRS